MGRFIGVDAGELPYHQRMSFLAGLNDAQRRAVDHHEGPLLRQPSPSHSFRALGEHEHRPVAGSLWSGSLLQGHLKSVGFEHVWEDRVLPAMKGVAGATMRCGVKRAEPRRNSFELYGLDMVLDEEFRPWLIEVCIACIPDAMQ